MLYPGGRYARFLFVGKVWMQMTMGASVGRGKRGDIQGINGGVGGHYEETELVEEQLDVG